MGVEGKEGAGKESDKREVNLYGGCVLLVVLDPIPRAQRDLNEFHVTQVQSLACCRCSGEGCGMNEQMPSDSYV